MSATRTPFDMVVDNFIIHPPTDTNAENPGAKAFWKGYAGDARPGDMREGSWLHAAYRAGVLYRLLADSRNNEASDIYAAH